MSKNIYEKIKKEDTKIDFKEVSLKSFSVKEMGNYHLKPLNEFIDKEKFFEYLKKIEKASEYFTYYRGNNMKKYFQGTLENIKKHELGKFFIVGQKGDSFVLNTHEFQTKKEESKTAYIDQLIEKIENRYPNFDKNKLPCENKIATVKALIHIAGIEVFEEKKNSFYISVAVGNYNLKVAKGFVETDNKDLFVIMGVEKVSNEIFNSEDLKKYNVQEKIIIEEEQELLIKDVLWPFSIIGVFAFIGGEKEFIVNPWLVDAIDKDALIDDYYFKVNQELFDETYKKNGYNSYIYKPW